MFYSELTGKDYPSVHTRAAAEKRAGSKLTDEHRAAISQGMKKHFEAPQSGPRYTVKRKLTPWKWSIITIALRAAYIAEIVQNIKSDPNYYRPDT